MSFCNPIINNFDLRTSNVLNYNATSNQYVSSLLFKARQAINISLSIPFFIDSQSERGKRQLKRLWVGNKKENRFIFSERCRKSKHFYQMRWECKPSLKSVLCLCMSLLGCFYVRSTSAFFILERECCKTHLKPLIATRPHTERANLRNTTLASAQRDS